MKQERPDQVPKCLPLSLSSTALCIGSLVCHCLQQETFHRLQTQQPEQSIWGQVTVRIHLHSNTELGVTSFQQKRRQEIIIIVEQRV